MNLEFKVKQLNIDLYGETVSVRYPTVRELKAHEQKAKKSKDDFSLMKEFLCSIGMTDKQIDSCYPDDLNKIVSILSGDEGK